MSNSTQSRITRRAALTLGGAVALVPVTGRAQTPGLIVAGGPIYTGRGNAERVEAVAMRGDRIVFVGSLAGALHADYRIPSVDLVDFLKLTQLMTRDAREVLHAFERCLTYQAPTTRRPCTSARRLNTWSGPGMTPSTDDLLRRLYWS